MDEQITRALYLGSCIMILVLAFTSFTAYHDYQAYASHVRHHNGSQGVARRRHMLKG